MQTHTKEDQNVKTCPKCKSKIVLEFIYGMSTPDEAAKLDSNKYIPMGCIMPPNPHRWFCKKCSHEWGVLIS